MHTYVLYSRHIHMYTYIYIYIHTYIYIYIYLYAQLVISIHKVRQGKLQTASCWAHASTSCSGDMFNAKSMPKSDQNLGVWMWLLQSVSGASLQYIKGCSIETSCENRNVVFCLLVLEKRALQSTRTPLKQLLFFFSLFIIQK